MNIKVAIIGQYLEQSGIIATFQDSQDNRWTEKLFNPREHGRNLLKDPSKECFVIWYDETIGWNYGIILHSPTDTRDGYVMIVVCTGMEIIGSGDSLLKSLIKLSKLFFDNKFQSAQDLHDRCKDEVKEICSSVRLSYIQPIQSDPKKKGDAYRIFSSEEDLLTIFQYPNQPEYTKYKRLFLVSSVDREELAKTGYEEIKEPVLKVYSVLLPDNGNVSVSKNTVHFSDTIVISYHKQYCEDYECHFTIDDEDNNFISYHGNSIEIADEVSAGVEFSRFIKLDITSDKGKKITRVNYNPKPSIPFKEDNLMNGIRFQDGLPKYAIHLEAKGYEGVDVCFTDEDFSIGTKKVRLKAKKVDFQIQLSTDNKTVKGTVSVKTDDPLYEYLESRSQRPIMLYTINKQDSPKSWKKIMKKILFVLAGLMLVWILYAVLCLRVTDSTPWPLNSEDNVNPTDTVSDNAASMQQDTTGISHDIIYLKKNDTWDKAKLQSQKYQSLCDFVTNGQIDEILQSNWFDNDSLANGFWQNEKGNGIYNMLNSINENSTLKGNASQAMRECSSNGTYKAFSPQK